MTLEVRLRPEAEQDVSDAAAWYGEKRAGLGHEFLDEIVVMFSAIAEAPLMYPNVYRNVRRALIHRFPFSVYNLIVDATVVVLAVMHGSRNPRRWKSRA